MIRLLLSLSLVLGSIVPAQATPVRLNFVFILGDDINRDQLGPYGGECHTPNLDTLAREGVRFDNAYVNVAMCASFRQELYSGRVTWRTKTMLNHSNSVEGTKSLPHYLQPLGYQIGLIGKTHIGPKTAYPFDYLGPVPKGVGGNDAMMKLAKSYILDAQDKDAPFCLFLASNDGHAPFTTGDPSQYEADEITIPPYWIDTPTLRQEVVKHMAEVTNLDALLGRVRSFLKAEAMDHNTIVIFCSEQGNQFPFAKWTCFDNGLHTGLVAACPDVIPAGTVSEQLFWIADIAPTLLQAAGGEADETAFDGKSQWANFLGNDEPVHDFAYGAFSNKGIIDNRERIYPIRVIRDQRYSLIWSPRGETGQTSNVTLTKALAMLKDKQKAQQKLDPASSWVAVEGTDTPLVRQLHHRPEWALYDRKTDPYELTNLAENPEKAPVLNQLRGQLSEWLETWGDSDPVATEEALTTNRSEKGKKPKKPAGSAKQDKAA